MTTRNTTKQSYKGRPDLEWLQYNVDTLAIQRIAVDESRLSVVDYQLFEQSLFDRFEASMIGMS